MPSDSNEDVSGTMIGLFLMAVCVFIIIAGVITFSVQHEKENNYTESMCLVLNSEITVHTCYASDDPEPDPDPDPDPHHPTSSKRTPYPTSKETARSTTKNTPQPTTKNTPQPTTKNTPRPTTGKTRYAASNEKLTTPSPTNIRRTFSCYVPVWYVQYNDLRTSVDTTSRSSTIDGQVEHEYYGDAQYESNKYQIGSSYTCYYDKLSTENNVQWDKPNSAIGIIILIVGIAGLLIIAALVCSGSNTGIQSVSSRRSGYERVINT